MDGWHADAESFPLRRAFAISRGARAEAVVVTARLCRGGLEGRGEGVPYARYGETVAGVLAQVAALPPDADEEAVAALPPGAARNAADCALLDWRAKRASVRAWDLLGLPAPGPVPTAFTLSLDEPSAMEGRAREEAHRPILKVKLGTPADLPRLEAVRRGAPRARLLVDANEGWTADDYLALCPHLLRLGVALVEQPLPEGEDEALRGLPRPVPLCADESVHVAADVPRLLGLYDSVNVKLDKAGGLGAALALRDAARAAGLSVMVGCMVGTSLAMAPAVLVAQGAALADLDGPLLLAQDRPRPLLYDERGVHPPERELWG